MNRAWHRLDPWPDSVPGLLRLKTRYVIAPCSNGNIALIVNMAKRAGLPWDVVLGAEPARAYKPEPEAYLASCRMLDLAPVGGVDGGGAQRRPRRQRTPAASRPHSWRAPPNATSSPIRTSTSPPTTSRISRRSSIAELVLRVGGSVRREGGAEPMLTDERERDVGAFLDPRRLVELFVECDRRSRRSSSLISCGNFAQTTADPPMSGSAMSARSSIRGGS